MNVYLSRGVCWIRCSYGTCAGLKMLATNLTNNMPKRLLSLPVPMTYSRLHLAHKMQIIDVRPYCSTTEVEIPAKKRRFHPYQILKEELRLEEEYLNQDVVDFKAIASICEKNSIHNTMWQNFCIEHFYRTGDIKNSIAFIDFIEKQSPAGASLTISVVYMGLAGKSGPEYQDIVYKTFEKLEKLTDVFHLSLLKYLVEAFCGTERWRKSLEFLEMEKFQNDTISAAIRGPIIVRAFQEGDVTLAKSLLQDLADGVVEPHQQFFVQMIELAKNKNSAVNIQMFINLLKERRWYPDSVTAEKLKEYFLGLTDEKWRCEIADIDHKGVCPSCSFTLPVANFEESDFEHLKKEIMQKLIITSNVYLNSNPREVEQFRDFLEQHGPFDIVIDGLNVGLRQCPLDNAYKVRLAVEYFTRQNLKVFVMGRKHMKRWTKKHMSKIEHNSSIFYTDNVSKDDPFLLYAACHSGGNALILTHDMLRNHGTRISGEYQPLYYKWLQCRQISDFYLDNIKLTVKIPAGYEVEPVCSSLSYHIPYRYSNGFQWLCLTRID